MNMFMKQYMEQKTLSHNTKVFTSVFKQKETENNYNKDSNNNYYQKWRFLNQISNQTIGVKSK